MATLEEQRRATAAGMAASRAPTGQAQRRAGGQAMIERRTGKAVAEDINRLTGTQTRRRMLRPIEPVGALPPSRGRGVYQVPPATGTGGVASPLVEIPDSRQYHNESKGFYSNDYLIFTRVQPLKSMEFTDANGAAVMMQFAVPVED